MILTLGDNVQLRFNLDIAGTSAHPSEVRVVLGKGPHIIARATPITEGEWEANLPLAPGILEAGKNQLSIEVLLNGRLLTPIKREVELVGETKADPVEPDEQDIYCKVEPAPVVELPVDVNPEQPKPSIIDLKSIFTMGEKLEKPKVDVGKVLKDVFGKTDEKPVEPKVDLNKQMKQILADLPKPKAKPKVEKPKKELKVAKEPFQNVPPTPPLKKPYDRPACEVVNLKVESGSFRISKTKTILL